MRFTCANDLYPQLVEGVRSPCVVTYIYAQNTYFYVYKCPEYVFSRIFVSRIRIFTCILPRMRICTYIYAQNTYFYVCLYSEIVFLRIFMFRIRIFTIFMTRIRIFTYIYTQNTYFYVFSGSDVRHSRMKSSNDAREALQEASGFGAPVLGS